MPVDAERILRVLAHHRVEHVVVGGIAAVLQGSPLATDDLDIVPALETSNLNRLAAALEELNARIRSHEEPDGIEVEWTGPDLRRWIVDFRFLHLATDYGNLDLVHRPQATNGYDDLARGANVVELEDVEIKVAALEDVIRSKEAVGRDRDRIALPTLRLLLEARDRT